MQKHEVRVSIKITRNIGKIGFSKKKSLHYPKKLLRWGFFRNTPGMSLASKVVNG